MLGCEVIVYTDVEPFITTVISLSLGVLVVLDELDVLEGSDVPSEDV